MTVNKQLSEQEKRAIINYLAGEMTPDDYRILNELLSKSDENKLLIDQLSDIWTTAGFHKNFNTGKAWKVLQEQITSCQKKKNGINFPALMRYAAIFIVALFLGALGYYMLNTKQASVPESSFIEYVSPLGLRSFVQLSDGSKIWLNAGTTLR